VPASRSCCAGKRSAGCLIGVRLKPAAFREKIISIGADECCIAVTAAPVDGKANEAMVKLLSRLLDVPKSSIFIRRGVTSRSKLVEIAGMDKAEVMKRLKVEKEQEK
jgi:uncharacterized protein (TIGR00251 family)